MVSQGSETVSPIPYGNFRGLIFSVFVIMKVIQKVSSDGLLRKKQ